MPAPQLYEDPCGSLCQLLTSSRTIPSGAMPAFVQASSIGSLTVSRRRLQCRSRAYLQRLPARRHRARALPYSSQDVVGPDLGEGQLEIEDAGAVIERVLPLNHVDTESPVSVQKPVDPPVLSDDPDGIIARSDSCDDEPQLFAAQRRHSHDGKFTDEIVGQESDGSMGDEEEPSSNAQRPAIYPRVRRSARDPHIASQTAHSTHLAQVSNHSHDPRTSLWRRQNSVLVDEARLHGIDAAVDMLWELSEQGRAASQNFNQVVSLLASEGRLQDGLELALEAGRREFANIITFRPLMKLCCSSGDGRAAKRVWRAMVDCGVEGDMFLYAELMGALVRSQDISSAERVLDSLQETGRRPHIVLYNTLLKGIAKLANVEQAFNVLDSIVDAGVKPDETTFNTILNTCVRAKDLDALNRAMALMRDHKIKPGVPTFNTLLKLYARAGKFQDALDIFHEMQQTVEPSIVTYNTLIDGCAHRGDMDRAALFFDEMIEKGMTPDICTMTSLLKGFGRSNNPARAVELYEAMKEGGYCIEERTRYAVINACLRGNDRTNAKRLMREMLDANIRIRPRTWIWMLETDIWCDDEDAALETIREMDGYGVYMDSATKTALLREARDRGSFLRFQRELKASRTSTTVTDRRRED